LYAPAARWFLIPFTILITLLGITLGFIGIRDFSDVHKASQRAIAESNEAKAKAQEAETKAGEAIKAIGDATAKMNTQLTSTQKLSDSVSGLEKRSNCKYQQTHRIASNGVGQECRNSQQSDW